MSKNSDARERTALAIRQPEFFEDLLDQVSDGETLLGFCEARAVIYGRVYRWIVGDEIRSSRFGEAESARAKNLSDRVIRGIISVDDVTLKDVLTDSGEVLPTGKIPKHVARAMQSIDVTTDQTGATTKKIRMYDRLKALEMAGRNQRMFTDKVEHSGEIGLADLVAASLAPARPAPAETENANLNNGNETE